MKENFDFEEFKRKEREDWSNKLSELLEGDDGKFANLLKCMNYLIGGHVHKIEQKGHEHLAKFISYITKYENVNDDIPQHNLKENLIANILGEHNQEGPNKKKILNKLSTMSAVQRTNLYCCYYNWFELHKKEINCTMQYLINNSKCIEAIFNNLFQAEDNAKIRGLSLDEHNNILARALVEFDYKLKNCFTDVFIEMKNKMTTQDILNLCDLIIELNPQKSELGDRAWKWAFKDLKIDTTNIEHTFSFNGQKTHINIKSDYKVFFTKEFLEKVIANYKYKSSQNAELSAAAIKGFFENAIPEDDNKKAKMELPYELSLMIAQYLEPDSENLKNIVTVNKGGLKEFTAKREELFSDKEKNDQSSTKDHSHKHREKHRHKHKNKNKSKSTDNQMHR